MTTPIGDLEFTIFDRHSLLLRPSGPRWTVFETYNRVPSREFKSLKAARKWLEDQGFKPGSVGNWIHSGELPA